MAKGKEEGMNPNRSGTRESYQARAGLGDDEGPQDDAWLERRYHEMGNPKPDNSYYDAGRLRDDTKPRYS